MRAKVLSINHIDVSYDPIVYTCFGLGSCIGLFMTDRTKKISGGAHIPMPVSSSAGEFLGATEMIGALLQMLGEQGSDLSTLRAKITGGAQVFRSTVDVGRQNSQYVLQLLRHHKIYLAGSDIGGFVSRTARFFSETGELHISSLGQQTYCI